MTEDWTFYLATFGCKVNQYESQALREAWRKQNGRETDDPAGADWIVLNTCAVTARAVSDARQAVRNLHRQAPDARIVLAGCAATTPELARLSGDPASDPASDLAEDLAGVTAVIAQADKERLLEGPPFTSSLSGSRGSLGSFPESGGSRGSLGSSPGQGGSPDSTGRHWPSFRIASFQRSRPVLKVQDGCSQGCTYCIVPLTRGPARSRAPEEILAEAERLLAAGHRELMLSGINLREYRAPDADRADFWGLLAWLDAALAPKWQGRARLRVSSIDPAQLARPDGRVGDILAAAHLVCPHLHLSLQSGSPAVLRRMGRGHYDPGRLPEAAQALSAVWPVFGLGADVIMGFPGETRAECRETLDLLHALPLSYAHVFPYSRRPGTAAAALPDLPGPEKRARAALARAVVAEKRRSFLKRLLKLPEVRLALDAPPGSAQNNAQNNVQNRANARAARGVTEFYAACVLPGAHVPAHGFELLRARPTGIDGMRLTAELL